MLLLHLWLKWLLLRPALELLLLCTGERVVHPIGLRRKLLLLLLRVRAIFNVPTGRDRGGASRGETGRARPT